MKMNEDDDSEDEGVISTSNKPNINKTPHSESKHGSANNSGSTSNL